jgi:hypothetical protein
MAARPPFDVGDVEMPFFRFDAPEGPHPADFPALTFSNRRHRFKAPIESPLAVACSIGSRRCAG